MFLGLIRVYDTLLSLGVKMVYQIVCAWCGKDMGKKEYASSKIMDNPISHSICECCKSKVLAEIEQLKREVLHV